MNSAENVTVRELVSGQRSLWAEWEAALKLADAVRSRIYDPLERLEFAVQAAKDVLKYTMHLHQVRYRCNEYLKEAVSDRVEPKQLWDSIVYRLELLEEAREEAWREKVKSLYATRGGFFGNEKP